MGLGSLIHLHACNGVQASIHTFVLRRAGFLDEFLNPHHNYHQIPHEQTFGESSSLYSPTSILANDKFTQNSSSHWLEHPVDIPGGIGVDYV